MGAADLGNVPMTTRAGGGLGGGLAMRRMAALAVRAVGSSADLLVTR
jgi:hypothetical protein